MLTEAQIEEFHRNGYLRGSNVLSDDAVETLRSEIARVIESRDVPDVPQPVRLRNMGTADAEVWQIVNIWEASAPFLDLVHHPKIAEEIAQLTGATTLRLWHDQIQYKPASKGGVNMWHQDAPLWPVLAPMTEVSAWVALDDVDAENGCMSMVPGSHLWGNHMDYLRTLENFDAMSSEYEGQSITVKTCPVRKGEVHYHHALTWHGSNANRSDRPRRAIALHFMAGDTRFVASGNHVMRPFMDLADGAVVHGEHFPVIFEANLRQSDSTRQEYLSKTAYEAQQR